MPKLTGLWEKVFDDNGVERVKYATSKPAEIDGKPYWIDVYPSDSTNPQAPAFNLYIKEAEPKG